VKHNYPAPTNDVRGEPQRGGQSEGHGVTVPYGVNNFATTTQLMLQATRLF